MQVRQTEIELGGSTRGSQYDAILSSGNVNLGGTLIVSLINSFTPVAGSSFDILDWGAGAANSPVFLYHLCPLD